MYRHQEDVYIAIHKGEEAVAKLNEGVSDSHKAGQVVPHPCHPRCIAVDVNQFTTGRGLDVLLWNADLLTYVYYCIHNFLPSCCIYTVRMSLC